MSIASTIAPESPVTRRAKSPRATSRQRSQNDSKPRKVSFYLSPESIRRLGVAASMSDTDKSKVLEQILATTPVLKRYVISDRSRPDIAEDRQPTPS